MSSNDQNVLCLFLNLFYFSVLAYKLLEMSATLLDRTNDGLDKLTNAFCPHDLFLSFFYMLICVHIEEKACSSLE